MKKEIKKRIHAGNPDKSFRLAIILTALKEAGKRGRTTRQLQRLADDCGVHTSIWELRSRKYNISCKYEGTQNERRIYRYRLHKQEKSPSKT